MFVNSTYLFNMLTPRPLNKKANTPTREKKQNSLNRFLLSKDGNTDVVAKKIMRKNIRDELKDAANEHNKKMKIARDSFNKEHRLANTLIARKSKKTAFIQGVVNGISEVQSILLEKDKSAGTIHVESNVSGNTHTDLDNSAHIPE